jgi:GntR family transcriptional repressor for pyruvate dehydrogenase complex
VSVREALHDLEMKGMIDRKPGRGTIVIASDRAAGIGSLLARLPDDERGLLEIMDFRSAIEPPIAARAAARATPRDLRTLYDLVSRMESASDDEETKALDEAFHTAVARATHNSMFVKLLTLTADWLSASRQMGLQSHRRRQASIEAHRRIVEAIAARDAHGGLVAMAEHIDSINHLLSEQLSGPARRLRGTWPAETDHEPTTPAGSG